METDPPETGIIEQVIQALVSVIGDEFLLDVDVTMETSFSADLAIESIELVALGEQLQLHFGKAIHFAAFIGSMSIDEIVRLTVGDLVGYIARELAGLGASLGVKEPSVG